MKPWRSLSNRQVRELQKQKCEGCKYLALITGETYYCNYSLTEGKCRLNDPRECDKYVPRDEEKRNRPIF